MRYFNKKPLTFIPAIIMIYIIFSFSAQKGATSCDLSYKVSYEVVRAFNTITFNKENISITKKKAKSINLYIRKTAHVTEYFILCGTIVLPLYTYVLRYNKLLSISFIISVLLACLDEFHQHFVSGRYGNIKDVFIDSTGIIIFLFIYYFLNYKKIYSYKKPLK